MIDSLDGKVALVTGGSSGVGKAVAWKLASEGAIVVICARAEEKLNSVALEMQEKGLQVFTHPGDVANEEDAGRIVEDVMARFEKIDFLINCAGVGYVSPVEETTTERFDEMMGTNVRGVFLMTKFILPSMKKRRFGYIINISSGAGKNGIPNMSAYCASKYAVRGFSEAVALEARDYDVKVSILYPGSINTGFHLNIRGHELDQATKDTMMQPEDIAETVHHMLIQPARYWIFDVTTRAFLRGRK